MDTNNKPDPVEALRCEDLFGWAQITDRLPKAGDLIACCAEHKSGGLMHWAGRVLAVECGFAEMETRGDETRRFIITKDTKWTLLPARPQWHSVAEKLPDCPVIVWVSAGGGSALLARCKYGKWEDATSIRDLPFRPLYWQPLQLPEPPPNTESREPEPSTHDRRTDAVEGSL